MLEGLPSPTRAKTNCAGGALSPSLAASLDCLVLVVLEGRTPTRAKPTVLAGLYPHHWQPRWVVLFLLCSRSLPQREQKPNCASRALSPSLAASPGLLPLMFHQSTSLPLMFHQSTSLPIMFHQSTSLPIMFHQSTLHLGEKCASSLPHRLCSRGSSPSDVGLF